VFGVAAGGWSRSAVRAVDTGGAGAVAADEPGVVAAGVGWLALGFGDCDKSGAAAAVGAAACAAAGAVGGGSCSLWTGATGAADGGAWAGSAMGVAAAVGGGDCSVIGYFGCGALSGAGPGVWSARIG